MSAIGTRVPATRRPERPKCLSQTKVAEVLGDDPVLDLVLDVRPTGGDRVDLGQGGGQPVAGVFDTAGQEMPGVRASPGRLRYQLAS